MRCWCGCSWRWNVEPTPVRGKGCPYRFSIVRDHVPVIAPSPDQAAPNQPVRPRETAVSRHRLQETTGPGDVGPAALRPRRAGRCRRRQPAGRGDQPADRPAPDDGDGFVMTAIEGPPGHARRPGGGDRPRLDQLVQPFGPGRNRPQAVLGFVKGVHPLVPSPPRVDVSSQVHGIVEDSTDEHSAYPQSTQ